MRCASQSFSNCADPGKDRRKQTHFRAFSGECIEFDLLSAGDLDLMGKLPPLICGGILPKMPASGCVGCVAFSTAYRDRHCWLNWIEGFGWHCHLELHARSRSNRSKKASSRHIWGYDWGYLENHRQINDANTRLNDYFAIPLTAPALTLCLYCGIGVRLSSASPRSPAAPLYRSSRRSGVIVQFVTI